MSSSKAKSTAKVKDTKPKGSTGNIRPQSGKPTPKQSEKEKCLNDEIKRLKERIVMLECNLDPVQIMEKLKISEETLINMLTEENAKLRSERSKYVSDDSETSNKAKKSQDDMKKLEADYNARLKQKDTEIANLKKQINEMTEMAKVREKEDARGSSSEPIKIDSKNQSNVDVEKRNQTELCLQEKRGQKYDSSKLQSPTPDKETIQELRKQLEGFEENKKKLQSAEQKLNDQSSTIESLTTEKAKVQEEILELREKLKETQEEGKKNSSTKSDTGTKAVDELQKKIEEIEQVKNKLTTAQSEIDRLKREKANVEKEATDVNKANEQEIKRLKEDNKKIKEESDQAIKKLQKENSTKEVKHSDKTNAGTNNLQEKLKKAQDEIDELKNRLSKVVGAKLMTDNPNITDLSDENRPTKLSEKYSELYDNEWTDAYEEAENEFKTEEKGIEHLYKTLLDVFDFCKKKSVEHENNICSCVMSLPNSPNPKSKSPEISVTNQRQLKEIRKSFAPMLVESVFQNYLKEKKLNLSKKKNTEKFIRKSVEICWLMNSQDPPVIIDSTVVTGKPFDADKYRTYTKTGNVVDYVVWPPMLLHKNGPMLCKGVAQGK